MPEGDSRGVRIRSRNRRFRPEGDSPSISIFHSALDLSVRILARHILALIVKLLSSAKADRHLYVRALEIKREGNEGESISCDKSRKLHYLTLMHKKLSRAKGIAVEYIALFIGAYMYAEREKLADRYAAEVADGVNAAAKGYIDDVIDPAESRKMLIAAIEMLASKRDSNPPKKHGNMPL